MQRNLSEIRDVDKKILQQLEDKDLFQVLLIKNKYLYSLVDDMFWKNRLLNKYIATVQYKPKNQKWKQYYLNVIYYIDKLINEKGFIYTQGDPFLIYNFLFERVYAIPLEENIRYLVGKGYQDLLMYYVNSIKTSFNLPPLVLGTQEWKDYLSYIYNKYQKID